MLAASIDAGEHWEPLVKTSALKYQEGATARCLSGVSGCLRTELPHSSSYRARTTGLCGFDTVFQARVPGCQECISKPLPKSRRSASGCTALSGKAARPAGSALAEVSTLSFCSQTLLYGAPPRSGLLLARCLLLCRLHLGPLWRQVQLNRPMRRIELSFCKRARLVGLRRPGAANSPFLFTELPFSPLERPLLPLLPVSRLGDGATTVDGSTLVVTLSSGR